MTNKRFSFDSYGAKAYIFITLVNCSASFELQSFYIDGTSEKRPLYKLRHIFYAFYRRVVLQCIVNRCDLWSRT